MKQKPIAQRVGEFLEGKGFYIVLFLCVAAIGISGYYLFSTLNQAGGETAVSAPAQVIVTPSPSLEAVKPSVSPAPSPSQKTEPARSSPSPAEETGETPQTAPSSAPAAQPSEEPAASFFTWPLKGEVLADWSLEVLAYDETMGDWRIHDGVDISSPVGTQVAAVAAGTVASVEQDDLMGTTVTISHGGGVESVYANLAAQPAVEAGDTVKAGDVIGAVGETAIAESARLPHLHLEMRVDGESVDPLNYLPEQ